MHTAVTVFVVEMIKKTLLIFMVLVVSGCSGGPGAPLVRTSPTDGEGPLVPDCENIASDDTTRTFITDRYLTTWASASREGSAEGLYQGATKNLEGIRDEDIQMFAYGLLPSSATFCKVYTANPNGIFRIVSDLMPQFGYELKYAKKASGIIGTRYVYRAHPDVTWKCVGCAESQVLQRSNAKWKDRYILRIEPGKNDLAVVKVFRDVYVSRRSEGEWSDYIRATSVGHNEAVILNRINDVLSRNDAL